MVSLSEFDLTISINEEADKMGFLSRLFGKKQSADERNKVFFPFIIYDEGEKIESNKWYQKSSWKNKNFVRYSGRWSSDWKYAGEIPGTSNVKVAGISQKNRAYYFAKLAQSDDFKMYLENDPTNPVNKNARKVMVSGTVDGELLTKHIGYLPDEIANAYAGVELNISPRSTFLPTSKNQNVGVEVILLQRSARYLKKQAKEEAVKR